MLNHMNGTYNYCNKRLTFNYYYAYMDLKIVLQFNLCFTF